MSYDWSFSYQGGLTLRAGNARLKNLVYKNLQNVAEGGMAPKYS